MPSFIALTPLHIPNTILKAQAISKPDDDQWMCTTSPVQVHDPTFRRHNLHSASPEQLHIITTSDADKRQFSIPRKPKNRTPPPRRSLSSQQTSIRSGRDTPYPASCTASVVDSISSSESSPLTPSAGGFSLINIQPDPLPPHSNPFALSPTQSEAFSSRAHRPQLDIGRDEIRDAFSGARSYTIHQRTSSYSSKCSNTSCWTVYKAMTAESTGTLQFSAFDSTVVISVRDRSVCMTPMGLLYKRWEFAPRCEPGSQWVWRKQIRTGAIILESHGLTVQVLAKLVGNSLKFERSVLAEDVFDEVVLSAIAVVGTMERTG